MNGLLKVSLSVTLVAGLCACNGGGGSGGGAPAPQPVVNPNAVNPNYNYLNTNLNGPLQPAPVDNYQVPNFAMSAQGQGIIINRQLRLAQAGINQQVISDSCTSSNYVPRGNGCLNSGSYCQVPVNQYNLVLTWDASGNLSIVSYNEYGNASSANGIQYSVNSGSRMIVINPYQLNGYPSQSYVNTKMSQSSYAQMMANRNYSPFDINGAYSSYGNFNISAGNMFMPPLQSSSYGPTNVNIYGNNNQVAQQTQQGSISIQSSGFSLLFDAVQSDPSGRLAAHLRLARIPQDTPAQSEVSILVNGQTTSCLTDVQSNLLGIFN